MNEILNAATGRIIDALQSDSRLSLNALARFVGLSTPAVSERVRKLADSQVIRGFSLILDRKKLGWPITAFVRLQTTTDRYRAVHRLAETVPEVLECHHTAGDDGFMLKIIARDLEELEDIVEQCRILGDTSTSVVLSTYVEGKPVPVLKPKPDRS